MKYFSDDTVSTQKAHSLEAMCMCKGATWDQAWTLVQAALCEGVEAVGPSPTAELCWESSEGLPKLKSPAGKDRAESRGQS